MRTRAYALWPTQMAVTFYCKSLATNCSYEYLEIAQIYTISVYLMFVSYCVSSKYLYFSTLSISVWFFGSSVFYFLFSLFWLYLWMRQCSFNWTDAMRFINKKKRSWQKGHDCHCKHFKCANGNMYKWSRTLSFTVTIPFVATILAQTKLSHVKWLW